MEILKKICFLNFYLYSYLTLIVNCSKQKTFLNEISLKNTYPTLQNSEVYHSHTIVNTSTTISFIIRFIPEHVRFLIIQSHSYKHNLTLSYMQDLILSNHVNGTNIGIILETGGIISVFLSNYRDDVNIETDVSIHAFNNTAPVPGGCNMEFNIADAPFLQTVLQNRHVIAIEAAQAKSSIDSDCESSFQNVTYEFYHLYLREWDDSSKEYFSGIKKMLTVENILKYGEKVPDLSVFTQVKKLFSVYPGTGRVYTVIVNNGNVSSPYVPIHTFGFYSHEGLFIDIFLLFLLFINGIAISTIGFKTNHMHNLIFGTFLGILILYASYQVCEDGWCYAKSSFVFGSIVVIFFAVKMLYGSHLLPNIAFGVLTICVVFYSLPDGILQNDQVYLTLLLFILWISGSIAVLSKFSCFVIIGIFSGLLLIDFIIGSYVLRYMVINILRRGNIQEFNNVLISPPFQWRDMLILSIWLFLFIARMWIKNIFSTKRLERASCPEEVQPVLSAVKSYDTIQPESSNDVNN